MKKAIIGTIFVLISLLSLSLLAGCSLTRTISLNVTNNTSVDAIFQLVQCDGYSPPEQIDVNAGGTNYINNYEIQGPFMPGTVADYDKYNFGFKFYDKSNNLLCQVTGNIADVYGLEFSVSLEYDSVNASYNIKISPEPGYKYLSC